MRFSAAVKTSQDKSYPLVFTVIPTGYITAEPFAWKSDVFMIYHTHDKCQKLGMRKADKPLTVLRWLK